ncbi:MAG: DUF5312 family protein [Spirochaetaceae bacterium]|jgi:hypothetical protein|nr:DUF5312 family protein [Spirochaetaceae bacterium]
MGFFDFLFGGNDPAVKKKRAVKLIAKEINQNKHRKFYKTSSGEITPVTGAFFYDIYKTTSAAQGFMKNAAKSAVLKQIVVEHFMSKELKEVYNRLSAESIEERGKSLTPKELSQQIQEDLNTFSAAFSITEMNIIDRCYNIIIAFNNFVGFDFFSLLKKIDSRIRERDFTYHPQFRYVSGKYLADNIKDFLDMPPFEATPDDWKTVLEILKKYKAGTNVIEPNQWKRLLAALQDVHRSGILVLMIRHIDQNPNWMRNFQVSEESIVDAFMKAKKTEVQVQIEKIKSDKRAGKRDALANKLFGSADITRLQYYTNANNDIFLKKGVEGYTYIAPLNYLQAFVTTHQDVRELCDIFLIRGQWMSQDVSRQISQGLHELSDITEQLIAFDNTLADNGINGSKLRNHLNKSKMDKGQITQLKVVLTIINTEAKEMLNKALDIFSQVGVYIKNLSADHAKTHPVLLVNWKEIESVSERPIDQRLEHASKALGDFTQLLQLYAIDDE